MLLDSLVAPLATFLAQPGLAPAPAPQFHALGEVRTSLYFGLRLLDDDFEPADEQTLLGIAIDVHEVDSISSFELGYFRSFGDGSSDFGANSVDVDACVHEIWGGGRWTYDPWAGSLHPYDVRPVGRLPASLHRSRSLRPARRVRDGRNRRIQFEQRVGRGRLRAWWDRVDDRRAMVRRSGPACVVLDARQTATRSTARLLPGGVHGQLDLVSGALRRVRARAESTGITRRRAVRTTRRSRRRSDRTRVSSARHYPACATAPRCRASAARRERGAWNRRRPTRSPAR